MTAVTEPASSSEAVALRRCTRMIRSRNAGVFLISTDVVFLTEALYSLAVRSQSITPELIARQYGIDAADVQVITHDPSWAIKVTFPRRHASGSIFDDDIDGSQQYIPLLDLTLPPEAADLVEFHAKTIRKENSMSDSFNTISRVTSGRAQEAIAAAKSKAIEVGHAFSIAVVDESGVLVAFERMDGAALVSIQLAQDKAYTAVSFGLSSDGWYDFIKDDAPLALGAPSAIDRLVTFGGGYPIMVDEKLIGGIGVSGGHWSTDMEIAQAGLSVFE